MHPPMQLKLTSGHENGNLPPPAVLSAHSRVENFAKERNLEGLFIRKKEAEEQARGCRNAAAVS